MGRKAAQPVPGKIHPVKVKLSPEIDADLWAFCEVHHGVPQNRIIEKAVREFIKADLARHPTLEAEWRALRDRLVAKPPLARFPQVARERDADPED